MTEIEKLEIELDLVERFLDYSLNDIEEVFVFIHSDIKTEIDCLKENEE